MLDFDKVVTPSGDGEVLVLPSPRDCIRALRANQASLRNPDLRLQGRTLNDVRQETRRRMGLPDGPLIVTGHQPEFLHPGVWAKHIVAARMARAVEGTAVNLVVDSDAPRSFALVVPCVRDDRVETEAIRPWPMVAGQPLEELSGLDAHSLEQFEHRIRECLGDRCESTLLPSFLQGMRAGEDFVAQMIGGRKAIEGRFRIFIEDRRVSRIWWQPMLAELLLHAPRFADAYNSALAEYRLKNRVRSPQRPLPNLLKGKAVEIPIWAYRTGEPRRRVFVRMDSDHCELFADHLPIGAIAKAALAEGNLGEEWLATMRPWKLRPRALALTLWARLLLADFFIHGIGGAKYDRISDTIFQRYFGIDPPEMGCVSATLRLDLPRSGKSKADLDAAYRRLRDLQWNPQRVLRVDDRLLQERALATAESHRLRQERSRDGALRQAVYRRIRSINQKLAEGAAGLREQTRQEVQRLRQMLESDAVALSREYFIGLFSPEKLNVLLDALPQEADFRV